LLLLTAYRKPPAMVPSLTLITRLTTIHPWQTIDRQTDRRTTTMPIA